MARRGGPILAVHDAMGINYDTRPKTGGWGVSAARPWGSMSMAAWRQSAAGWVLGVLDRSEYKRSEPKGGSASRDREEDMRKLFAKAQRLKEPTPVRTERSRMAAAGKRTLDGMRKRRRQGRAEAMPPRDSRSGRRRCGCGARRIRSSVRIFRIRSRHCLMQVVYAKEEKPLKGEGGDGMASGGRRTGNWS
jgi:hypothetical protein